MKSVENLFVTAMEECAEIQQAISKSLRFGLENHHPTSATTNAVDIMIEFYHLQTVIERLQSMGALPIFSQNIIDVTKAEKERQINKYQGLSIDLGLIEKPKEDTV